MDSKITKYEITLTRIPIGVVANGYSNSDEFRGFAPGTLINYVEDVYIHSNQTMDVTYTIECSKRGRPFIHIVENEETGKFDCVTPPQMNFNELFGDAEMVELPDEPVSH